MRFQRKFASETTRLAKKKATSDCLPLNCQLWQSRTLHRTTANSIVRSPGEDRALGKRTLAVELSSQASFTGHRLFRATDATKHPCRVTNPHLSRSRHLPRTTGGTAPLASPAIIQVRRTGACRASRKRRRRRNLQETLAKRKAKSFQPPETSGKHCFQNISRKAPCSHPAGQTPSS